MQQGDNEREGLGVRGRTPARDDPRSGRISIEAFASATDRGTIRQGGGGNVATAERLARRAKRQGRCAALTVDLEQKRNYLGAAQTCFTLRVNGYAGNSMAWPAKGVANLLLDLAEASEGKIDPLAMQKLVYFSEGWHLAILGESLVQEQFEAWRRGPVVPDLYHSLKHFGATPIHGRLVRYDYQQQKVVESERPSVPSSSDLVREVWRVYRRYRPGQLVALTHQFGSPWEVTWRNSEGAPDARIPKELIREWFTAEADRSQGRNLL